MSLSIRVELLAGRYTATHFNDRDRPEWPPHPARLFSAAVAAWADADEPDPEERQALAWLESQGPPELACDRPEEVGRRAVVTHFVPNNDTKGVLQLIPDNRGRQARTYPSVLPRTPEVWFTWPGAEPAPETRQVLDGLLARVGRLGHSSSLVSCHLGLAPEATLAPSEDGDLQLRVPVPGSLEALEEEFGFHQGCEPRVLPAGSATYEQVAGRTYGPGEQPGGQRFLLRISGRRLLPVARSLEVARTVHEALMSHGPQPPPEILSGHAPGPPGVTTAPSQQPHAAVVPLPFAGHPRADGSLQGVAILVPRGAPPAERAALAQAIAHWGSPGGTFALNMGRAGRLDLELAGNTGLPWTLRASTWARPARAWASVTPIVLDRFPKGLHDRHRPERQAGAEVHAAETIARACTHLGLPRPIEVAVLRDGPLAGVPPASAFPAFHTAGTPVARLCVHAVLGFAEPVRGPVLIGAGRFLGQGLCLPLTEPGSASEGSSGE